MLEDHLTAGAHGEEARLIQLRDVDAVELDLAPVGFQQADEFLDEHALANATLADDEVHGAPADREANPVVNLLLAKALVDCVEADEWRRWVAAERQRGAHARNPRYPKAPMTRSNSRMAIELPMTARVVARPTPAAPPCADSPAHEETSGTATP